MPAQHSDAFDRLLDVLAEEVVERYVVESEEGNSTERRLDNERGGTA
jgi:hypothetical protein